MLVPLNSSLYFSYPAAIPIRSRTRCQYSVANAMTQPHTLNRPVQTARSLVLRKTIKVGETLTRSSTILWSSSCSRIPGEFVPEETHDDPGDGEDDDEDGPGQHLVLDPLAAVVPLALGLPPAVGHGLASETDKERPMTLQCMVKRT